MTADDALTGEQVLAAELTDWRLLATALHARYRTPDFATGAAFVAAVSRAADEVDHHPAIDLRYDWVGLTLRTTAVDAVTVRDIDLARRISDIAAAHHLTAEPQRLALVELALDTADVAALGPFWAALLADDATAVDGDDVVDPSGQLPLLWFQRTEAHEPPRQRFHLDVWVPADRADHRIAAAVAAGGRVVDDHQAPAFTVLADPEGNRACVCTCLSRH